MARKGEWLSIEVENLDQLRRDIRRLQDDIAIRELKAANKEAAEIVASEAKSRAPYRSGALHKSIRAIGGQREASVRMGSPVRVPYAGPIIGGHGPPRPQGGFIRPNPFLQKSISDRYEDIKETYRERISKLARKHLGR